MQDELYTTPLGGSRRGGSGSRIIAATFAGALVLGMVATAGISWHFGWLQVSLPWSDQPPAIAAQDPAPPRQVAATIPPASADKLASLEARLAEINQQAAAASGNATRAESLMIAFAARRAIERGQPLGFLETQLRTRFGTLQPGAVDRVIAAATNPVTLDQLSEQLAALEPDLNKGSADESTWDWIGRETAELFVVRRADTPSPAPAQRLLRARQYLAGGRVDAAMDEVTRLPGHDAAKDWLARAQDYNTTQRALDILEDAALLQSQVTPAPVQPAPASSRP